MNTTRFLDIYFPYNEGTMMLNLPVEFMSLMLPFVHLFSKRTFKSVQVLVVGAILAPGKRTITAILRVMGLSQEKHFQNYHRVLSRAVWSVRAVSRVLLETLVTTLHCAWTIGNGFRRYYRA